MNGKDFSKKSFEKFSAKTYIDNKKTCNDRALKNDAVTASERAYNSWVRNPLAIQIFNKEIVTLKLEYIHLNPEQLHYVLYNNPADRLPVFISKISLKKCG